MENLDMRNRRCAEIRAKTKQKELQQNLAHNQRKLSGIKCTGSQLKFNETYRYIRDQSEEKLRGTIKY